MDVFYYGRKYDIDVKTQKIFGDNYLDNYYQSFALDMSKKHNIPIEFIVDIICGNFSNKTDSRFNIERHDGVFRVYFYDKDINKKFQCLVFGWHFEYCFIFIHSTETERTYQYMGKQENIGEPFVIWGYENDERNFSSFVLFNNMLMYRDEYNAIMEQRKNYDVSYDERTKVWKSEKNGTVSYFNDTMQILSQKKIKTK